MKNIIRKSLESVQSSGLAKSDYDLIAKICERAEKLDIVWKDRMTLFMDLENAAEEFNLDLKGLLDAKDFDFIHDVAGIQREINRRDEVKFDGLYVPRYARSNSVVSSDEAINPDNEDVNAMIRNTLKTNVKKTPKYFDELTALGYKLDNDAPSDQGFWGVEGPGQLAVVSKDLGHTRRLYKGNGWIPVHGVKGKDFEDKFKKVDYKNLLDKEPKKYEEEKLLSSVRDLKNFKWDVQWAKREIVNAQATIAKLEKEIEVNKKRIAEYESKAATADSKAKSLYSEKVIAPKLR